MSNVNKELLDKLQAIHSKVQSAFTYKATKINEWIPRPDDWDGEDFEGDCGEFMLACILLCKREGLKARALIIEFKSGGVGWHGVCEVEGYLLDNRKGAVIRRDDSEETYRYHAISGYTPDEPWHLIQPD